MGYRVSLLDMYLMSSKQKGVDGSLDSMAWLLGYLRLTWHFSSGTLSWQGAAIEAWLRSLSLAPGEASDRLAPAAEPISNNAAPAHRARSWT